MTDITKCFGEDCDKRDDCYRYTAPDGYWQSYFQAKNVSDVMTGECTHQISINRVRKHIEEQSSAIKEKA